MKLLWFMTWREIRFRWRNLLPFVLIAAALIFTSAAQVTFQESLVASGSPEDYMMRPTYMILLSAFALIGFVAAKTYFSLYSESLLGETGIRRALGMKRRDIRRCRVLLGFLCITAAALVSVPLALLYVYLFVASCASGDMTISDFVPLVYRIPFDNIRTVLLLMISVMMGGVLTGSVREKSIVSLLRRGKMPLEAETGKGDLPDEGSLRDYGNLYVRRSLRRCVKYNLVTAFLLILPMIFLLAASTRHLDSSTHTYALQTTYDMEAMAFVDITDEMVAEIEQISGVRDASAVKSLKKGYAKGIIRFSFIQRMVLTRPFFGIR